MECLKKLGFNPNEIQTEIDNFSSIFLDCFLRAKKYNKTHKPEPSLERFWFMRKVDHRSREIKETFNPELDVKNYLKCAMRWLNKRQRK